MTTTPGETNKPVLSFEWFAPQKDRRIMFDGEPIMTYGVRNRSEDKWVPCWMIFRMNQIGEKIHIATVDDEKEALRCIGLFYPRFVLVYLKNHSLPLQMAFELIQEMDTDLEKRMQCV